MGKKIIFCIAILSTTQAFGSSPCPTYLLVEQEIDDNGQTITTVGAGEDQLSWFFESEDGEPFRFVGSSSELFVELDQQTNGLSQKLIVGGIATALLASSIVVFRPINKIVKEGRKLVDDTEKQKYLRGLFATTGLSLGSLVAVASVPFVGRDQGWRKNRADLKELFINGRLAFDDDLVKVLESRLKVTLPACRIPLQSHDKKMTME